jgi:hypothetical protein
MLWAHPHGVAAVPLALDGSLQIRRSMVGRVRLLAAGLALASCASPDRVSGDASAGSRDGERGERAGVPYGSTCRRSPSDSRSSVHRSRRIGRAPLAEVFQKEADPFAEDLFFTLLESLSLGLLPLQPALLPGSLLPRAVGSAAMVRVTWVQSRRSGRLSWG